MSGPHLSVLVTALIDPVLAGTPFAPGQTGRLPDGPGRLRVDPTALSPWPRHSAGIIWCASYVELRRALPGLPQAHDQDDCHPEGSCVDLMVDFDRGGRLERADLEALGLTETLAAVGCHAEALEAAVLLGQPAETVCPALARLLGVLLAAARAPLS
ncbi:hypothetical protein [Nocardioides panaciterrulae]|uniref:Uncharacterized protein n=1 Tax=Nocardioides panaciterrulae TaxID=661492 RepID=A0A7Y9E9P2_9ACTN|nr:hypothetical protein [Nocardioides panaciterrulae]NYD43557.1 hypothetical protein [Nocardioides panaciterrulae]